MRCKLSDVKDIRGLAETLGGKKNLLVKCRHLGPVSQPDMRTNKVLRSMFPQVIISIC